MYSYGDSSSILSYGSGLSETVFKKVFNSSTDNNLFLIVRVYIRNTIKKRITFQSSSGFNLL